MAAIEPGDKVDTPVPTNEVLHGLYLGLSERVEGMAAELSVNTKTTESVQTNTADLVEAFASAKGAFKVLEGIGRVARPLMWISGFVGSALAAYATWKGKL